MIIISRRSHAPYGYLFELVPFAEAFYTLIKHVRPLLQFVLDYNVSWIRTSGEESCGYGNDILLLLLYSLQTTFKFSSLNLIDLDIPIILRYSVNTVWFLEM